MSKVKYPKFKVLCIWAKDQLYALQLCEPKVHKLVAQRYENPGTNGNKARCVHQKYVNGQMNAAQKYAT